MAFKFKPDPVFPAKISITAPGGAVAELDLDFKYRGKAEARQWWDELGQAERTFAEAAAEAVVGWRDVEDSDGNQVPFSADALAQLMDAYPASAREIVEAYLLSLVETRTKN